MKILHVIPSLSAVHGGPSRAMRLIELALLAQGVEVETATTDDDGPGRRMSFTSMDRPPAIADPIQSSSNKTVRRFFPKRLEFYKVSPGFAWWVFRHVRDYDVVHIHALFSFTSVMAAWAARRMRAAASERAARSTVKVGLPTWSATTRSSFLLLAAFRMA